MSHTFTKPTSNHALLLSILFLLVPSLTIQASDNTGNPSGIVANIFVSQEKLFRSYLASSTDLTKTFLKPDLISLPNGKMMLFFGNSIQNASNTKEPHTFNTQSQAVVVDTFLHNPLSSNNRVPVDDNLYANKYSSADDYTITHQPLGNSSKVVSVWTRNNFTVNTKAKGKTMHGVYARILDSAAMTVESMAGPVTEVFQSAMPWSGNLSVAGTSPRSLMVFWDNSEAVTNESLEGAENKSISIFGSYFDSALKPLLGGPQMFGENLGLKDSVVQNKNPIVTALGDSGAFVLVFESCTITKTQEPVVPENLVAQEPTTSETKPQTPAKPEMKTVTSKSCGFYARKYHSGFATAKSEDLISEQTPETATESGKLAQAYERLLAAAPAKKPAPAPLKFTSSPQSTSNVLLHTQENPHLFEKLESVQVLSAKDQTFFVTVCNISALYKICTVRLYGKDLTQVGNAFLLNGQNFRLIPHDAGFIALQFVSNAGQPANTPKNTVTLYGQLYNSQAKTVSGVFPIYSKPTHIFFSCQIFPKQRNVDQDVFFVSFQDAATHKLYGQFFGLSNGQKAGDYFRLNTERTLEQQSYPIVFKINTQAFGVTWSYASGNSDGSTKWWEIRGQVFEPGPYQYIVGYGWMTLSWFLMLLFGGLILGMMWVTHRMFIKRLEHSQLVGSTTQPMAPQAPKENLPDKPEAQMQESKNNYIKIDK